MAIASGCLDENLVLALLGGGLRGAALEAAEQHLGCCDECLQLLAQIAPAEGEGASGSSAVRVLADRFVLGPRMAAGGMGAVHRGLDRATGLEVAIKRVRPEVAQDNPELLVRFAHEGEVLRRLAHPNIVQLLDVVTDGDERYIVLEYVSGGSVRDVLRQQPRLPTGRVLGMLLELSDALARAHHVGVIHRDIKPENVLLAADGTPRLTDFGLALSAERPHLSSHGPVGTLPYLSPEALSGLPLDERTDLWSLGVMMFEMLAGQRPFQAHSPGALVTAILKGASPDLEALCPDLPVGVVDLVQQLLERDRHQRVQSARRVGAEIEALLAARGADATSPGALPRARSERRPSGASFTRRSSQLPAPGTELVGRVRELARLEELLVSPAARLVTVVGAGGMGKSRLALELCRRWQKDSAIAERGSELPCADGIHWVELAPLTEPAGLVSLLADALGFALSAERSPLEQLVDCLRGKRILLVLDNFEHLLSAAGAVARLLEGAPELRVLVTSRERLGLHAEALLGLTGLKTADPEQGGEALSALTLFTASARRQAPDFELLAAERSAALQLCRALGGLPLGIVLAASWVSVLSVGEIAREIDRDLDFLSTEARDVPNRQRSLRAVFEHSYRLLGPGERAVFARISSFRGGCTRPAAEAVALTSLRTLASLANKSLIRREPRRGRYEVHELARQFAEEKLRERPAEQAAARDRHAAYFAEFLAARERHLCSAERSPALREIDDELGNIRTAWDWMLEHAQLALIDRAIAALAVYFEYRGVGGDSHALFERTARTFSGGDDTDLVRRRVVGAALCQQLHFDREHQGASAQALLDEALRLLDPLAHPRERAFALILSLRVRGDREAFALADAGLELYRACGDRWGLSRALLVVSATHGNMFRREELFRESIAAQAAEGDAGMWLPSSLAMLSNVRGMQGRRAEARELGERSLAVAERLDDVPGVLNSLQILGNLERTLGNYAQAEALAQRGVALCRQRGSWNVETWCLALLGDIYKEQGRLGEAKAMYESCFARSQHHPLLRGMAQLDLGDIAMLEGCYGEARTRLTDALERLERSVTHWGIVLAWDYLGELSCREQKYDLAADCFRSAQSLALASGCTALSTNIVVGMARVAAARGQLERAVELASIAEHHIATEHHTRRRRLAPVLAELRERLPEEAFARAFERGRTLQLEAVREGCI